MDSHYTPPLALTIVSAVFLALGAICFLVVAVDIIVRRGWRSMMGVMVPVYPINAAYMMPVTLYVYWRYGRPSKPVANTTSKESSDGPSTPKSEESVKPHCHSKAQDEKPAPSHCHSKVQDEESAPSHCHSKTNAEASAASTSASPAAIPHCHQHAASRPMWATVLVGVSHCGAGCVLGDLVGEWLVYGTGASINGASIWAELLIDYAFALLFGIAFQYFSIAPMSGEWGLRSVVRAAKADVLSLTSFEVGAFAWMVIYQVGIFNYRLSMDTWAYWWLMQVGMVFGFATAMPVNYFLIKKGIKEPCA